MTEEEKYLFDLQGYLKVQGLLSPEEVQGLNRQIDRLLALPADQYPGNAVKHENSTIDSVQGTDVEISNITECGEPFEALIDHPGIMAYLKEMISHPRMRMTHAYSIIRSGGDATPLHRGRVPIMGQCEYRFEQGKFVCAMVKAVIYLTDIAEDDGGFSVIPGSHKSNFPCAYFVKGAPEKSSHPDDVPVMVEVTGKAGDVMLFTEDLTHGARTNRSGKERRGLYYSYQPCYMPDWLAPPSEELMARLTPQCRELMEAARY